MKIVAVGIAMLLSSTPAAHAQAVGAVTDHTTAAEQSQDMQRIVNEIMSMAPPNEKQQRASTKHTTWPRLTGESANYRVRWDVAPSGAGVSSSASFEHTATIGQSVDTGRSESASLAVDSGFLAPPDTDGDQLRDFLDNCMLAANADQRDTDGDGFGNACDADFNNDCFVNAQDLGLMRANFFTSAALFDLNGDGIVNVIDLGALRTLFFQPPGPSTLATGC